jgi:hypothetical protein
MRKKINLEVMKIAAPHGPGINRPHSIPPKPLKPESGRKNIAGSRRYQSPLNRLGGWSRELPRIRLPLCTVSARCPPPAGARANHGVASGQLAALEFEREPGSFRRK